MQSRREFITGALKAAGITAMSVDALNLLLTLGGKMKVAEAGQENHFIAGHVSAADPAADPAAAWAAWDGAAQASLASNYIFIALFDDLNVGADETGEGSMATGADLIVTEVGDVAGAAGDPPSRLLAEDRSDYFTWTKGLGLATLLATEWTVILKLQTGGWGALNYPFSMVADNCVVWARRPEGNSKMQVRVVDKNGSAKLDTIETTSDIPAGDPYWLAIWQEAGQKVRAGITDVRPTKWSDFAAGLRVEGSAAADLSDADIATWEGRIGRYSDSTSLYGKLYYIVLANKCLIDNDA